MKTGLAPPTQLELSGMYDSSMEDVDLLWICH